MRRFVPAFALVLLSLLPAPASAQRINPEGGGSPLIGDYQFLIGLPLSDPNIQTVVMSADNGERIEVQGDGWFSLPSREAGGAGTFVHPAGFSGAARAPEEACRQGDDRPEGLENAVHRDADDAEGQQDQPDDRIQNQRQKGQRPAQDEQDAPEQELGHLASPEGRITIAQPDPRQVAGLPHAPARDRASSPAGRRGAPSPCRTPARGTA